MTGWYPDWSVALATPVSGLVGSTCDTGGLQQPRTVDSDRLVSGLTTPVDCSSQGPSTVTGWYPDSSVALASQVDCGSQGPSTMTGWYPDWSVALVTQVDCGSQGPSTVIGWFPDWLVILLTQVDCGSQGRLQ